MALWQSSEVNHPSRSTDLGETSLWRRRGEGVRLRLLLTSPFLALGPDFGLLGASSSEEDDPVSKKTDNQKR